jgi:hypothetical protein
VAQADLALQANAYYIGWQGGRKAALLYPALTLTPLDCFDVALIRYAFRGWPACHDRCNEGSW